MNAVEHNPNSEKHIWISLLKQERGYVVAIADNGPGISDTMKASLFDISRRYRAAPSQTNCREIWGTNRGPRSCAWCLQQGG